MAVSLACSADTAVAPPPLTPPPGPAYLQRLPEKRPPVVISYAFAALVFVPLVAVLLYVTTGLKANVKVRWLRACGCVPASPRQGEGVGVCTLVCG